MIISARENNASAVYAHDSMVKPPLNNSYGQSIYSFEYGRNANSRADFNSVSANTLDRSRAGNKSDTNDDSKVRDKISGDQSLDKLTDSEKRQVEKLKQRDREVKAHEAAHLAAGGGLVRGGASYSYTSGPDNKRYATSGEVQIDISPASDPESTILKMQQVRRAALAPADPSAQDRSVAQTASKIEAQARQELRKEKFSENEDIKNVSSAIISGKNNDLAHKYIDVIADSGSRGSLLNAFAQ